MLAKFCLLVSFLFCTLPCVAAESPFLSIANKTYLDTATFAAWTGADIWYCEETGDLVFVLNDHRIETKIESVKAVLDGASAKLPFAPLRKAGRLYIPVNYVAGKCDLDFTFDAKQNCAAIYDKHTRSHTEVPAQLTKRTDLITRFKAPTLDSVKDYKTGMQFWKKELYIEAQASLEKSVQSSPAYGDAALALGKLYVEMGDRGKAQTVYKGLLARSPFSQAIRQARSALTALNNAAADASETQSAKSQQNKPRKPQGAQNANPLVGIWESKDVFFDDPNQQFSTLSRLTLNADGTGSFQYTWLNGEIDTVNFTYHTDGANLITEYKANTFTADRKQLTEAERFTRNILGRYIEDKVILTVSLSDDKQRLTVVGDLRAEILDSYKTLWSGMIEGGMEPGPRLISRPEPSIYSK